MSLLNGILMWATISPTKWQRDALRRLFQKDVLDQQDLDDLYAMLKSSHGIPDLENREPDPLSQKHLPAQTTGAAPVIFRSMRDLKHVNRIPNGQVLEFAPAVLNRCEFGRDDYSLEVEDLPETPIEPGTQATLFAEKD